MSTYLVTGGAGFIGSNFITYMLNRYQDIRIINVDLLTYAGNIENLAAVRDDPRHVFVREDICNQEGISKLFKENHIDHVVNFAAESHVDRSIATPSIFAETNVRGTVVLLDAARSAWEQADGSYSDHRFLQVSTDEVYGSLGEAGLFTEDTPLDPHSPYSASKASADMFVKAYGDTFGLPINITRCSNNYGPFQFPEKLIPLMITNVLAHKSLPVYGDGLNVRDWLFVEDHCKAIDMVLDKGIIGEIYNIGGNNESTNIAIIKTIIDYIRDSFDVSADESLIEYVEDRKGHDRRYGIDPEKIRTELGWYPETCFENGIAKTIQWYLENPAWIQNILSGSYRECEPAKDNCTYAFNKNNSERSNGKK